MPNYLSRLMSITSLFKSNSKTSDISLRPRKPLSSYYYSTDSYLSPSHIFRQIVTLQLIYYGIGTALILFTCLMAGRPEFSLKLVFSWTPVTSKTTLGWTLFMLWLLDTVFSVIALTVVVGRSKLALDFTLTLHGIHLVICWFVDGRFPASALWWGLQFLSIILMVILGTWTTQWRELRATFFENVPLDGGSIRQPIAMVDLEAQTQTLSTPVQQPAANSSPQAALLSTYNEYELEESEDEGDKKPSKSNNVTKQGLEAPEKDSSKGSSASRKMDESIGDESGDSDDGDISSLLKR